MRQRSTSAVRTATLPSGETIPVLGQGTWNMGERADRRPSEIAALGLGVDLGMTLIDTAEMYGSGAAEKLIAEAIGDRRDELFLVDKVMPQHATRRGTIASCEASLRRLKTDRIDLYLLHWRGTIPLDETLEAFDHLAASGKIRHWGVSNFAVDDMEELAGLRPGVPPAANQVLYNLTRRGIEHDLLPWCRARGIPIVAYSPVEQGRLLNNKTLKRVADRLTATAAQVALAWVLRQAQVAAIPKAGSLAHVRENRGALELTLAPSDLDELDRAFPPPKVAKPLEMI
jgi:diketogulonate reductase-like aldo/keto reductase